MEILEVKNLLPFSTKDLTKSNISYKEQEFQNLLPEKNQRSFQAPVKEDAHSSSPLQMREADLQKPNAEGKSPDFQVEKDQKHKEKVFSEVNESPSETANLLIKEDESDSKKSRESYFDSPSELVTPWVNQEILTFSSLNVFKERLFTAAFETEAGEEGEDAPKFNLIGVSLERPKNNSFVFDKTAVDVSTICKSQALLPNLLQPNDALQKIPSISGEEFQNECFIDIPRENNEASTSLAFNQENSFSQASSSLKIEPNLKKEEYRSTTFTEGKGFEQASSGLSIQSNLERRIAALTEEKGSYLSKALDASQPISNPLRSIIPEFLPQDAKNLHLEGYSENDSPFFKINDFNEKPTAMHVPLQMKFRSEEDQSRDRSQVDFQSKVDRVSDSMNMSEPVLQDGFQNIQEFVMKHSMVRDLSSKEEVEPLLQSPEYLNMEAESLDTLDVQGHQEGAQGQEELLKDSLLLNMEQDYKELPTSSKLHVEGKVFHSIEMEKTSGVSNPQNQNFQKIPNEVSVIQNVVDRIEDLAIHGRGGRAVIQLEPENLGTITIKVSCSGQQIKADILTSRHEVHDAIEQNRQSLYQAAEAKGMSFESFNVSQEGSPHQGSSYQQRHEDLEREVNLRMERTLMSSQAFIADRTLQGRASFSTHSGALDYII